MTESKLQSTYRLIKAKVTCFLQNVETGMSDHDPYPRRLTVDYFEGYDPQLLQRIVKELVKPRLPVESIKFNEVQTKTLIQRLLRAMEEQKFATTTSEDQFDSEKDSGGSKDDNNERQNGRVLSQQSGLLTFSTARGKEYDLCKAVVASDLGSVLKSLEARTPTTCAYMPPLAVNKVDKRGKVLKNAVIVKTLYDHNATSNRTGD